MTKHKDTSASGMLQQPQTQTPSASFTTCPSELILPGGGKRLEKHSSLPSLYWVAISFSGQTQCTILNLIPTPPKDELLVPLSFCLLQALALAPVLLHKSGFTSWVKYNFIGMRFWNDLIEKAHPAKATSRLQASHSHPQPRSLQTPFP